MPQFGEVSGVGGGNLLSWEEAVTYFDEWLHQQPPDDQIDFDLVSDNWQEFIEGQGQEPYEFDFGQFWLGAQTFAMNIAANSHPATLPIVYGICRQFGTMLMLMERKRGGPVS